MVPIFDPQPLYFSPFRSGCLAISWICSVFFRVLQNQLLLHQRAAGRAILPKLAKGLAPSIRGSLSTSAPALKRLNQPQTNSRSTLKQPLCKPKLNKTKPRTKHVPNPRPPPHSTGRDGGGGPANLSMVPISHGNVFDQLITSKANTLWCDRQRMRE